MRRRVAWWIAGVSIVAMMGSGGLALETPAAPVDLGELDEAWLQATYAALAGTPGFVDVGYMSEPTLHVALLYRHAIPDVLPIYHPKLETRAYVLDAEPLTHEAIVPVMNLLAQGIPPGIRPGQWMLAPHPCTFSFVVTDSTGALHILTAGHCVDFVGQDVSIRGAIGVFGKVRAFRDQGVGQDFAVIKVNNNKLGDVNPRTAGWGGPQGVATTTPTALTGVRHYGWGALTWMTHETRCRAGTGPHFWGATSMGWASVTIWGDSGSEIMLATGQAAGIVTHLSLLPTQGLALGTRLTHALSQLGSMTGTTYTLVDGGPIVPVCSNT